MNRKLFLLLPFVLYACKPNSNGQPSITRRENVSLINTNGRTIEQRFLPPSGYKRDSTDTKSFTHYLRRLPLKPHGSPVLHYDGSEKLNDGVYCGVVAMDIGKQNLQQCADAVMRLRAEYLYKIGEWRKIHFNFTNGYRADYSLWPNGYRIGVKGNKAYPVSRGKVDNNHATLMDYLETVFSYAGTLSLSRELVQVGYKDLTAGDVLIQGGSPGHAVIVVDVAVNSSGKKMYLLAQSYMPAQEIQVLTNPMNKDISPWYELDETQDEIQTPQWDFHATNLKRFPVE